MEKNNEKGSPLTESIKKIIQDIKDSLGPNEEIYGVVTLEMSTIIEKKKGIGVLIKVLDVGANVNSQEVHKINIPIKILNETERAKKLIELDKLWNSEEYKNAVSRYKKRQSN